MKGDPKMITKHSYKLFSYASLIIISSKLLAYILPILLLVYSKESKIKSLT